VFAESPVKGATGRGNEALHVIPAKAGISPCCLSIYRFHRRNASVTKYTSRPGNAIVKKRMPPTERYKSYCPPQPPAHQTRTERKRQPARLY